VEESNRDLALRWFKEVWNQGRTETIDELWAPGAVCRLEGSETPVTKAAFKAHHAAFLDALSNLAVRVATAVTDGERVVVNWTMTGQHTGSALGIAPSGREVQIRGVTWFEFRGGQLTGGFDAWNRGEMIASLMGVQIDEIRFRFGLTERQAQVALLMAERRTHKEIAKELGIKPNTARRHCQRVLEKLSVHNRHDVAQAMNWRELDGDR